MKGSNMAKQKKKQIYVQAELKVFTSLPIDADSFEGAVLIAKEMAVTEFVKILGEHIDSEIKITGVFE